MVLASILDPWLSGSAPVAQRVMLGFITVQIWWMVKNEND